VVSARAWAISRKETNVTTSKSALVIAGSSGIGAAAARALTEAGYHVSVVARSEKVEHLAHSIGGTAIRGDYTQPGVIEEAIADVVARTGRIDVVVTSAGHGAKGTLTELSADDFAAGFDLYFYNVLRAAKAAQPHMQAQGGGALINVSSASPTEPSPRFPTSMVARAAMTTWTKLFASEVAPQGIRVNNVLPGYTVEDPATVPAEWTASIPAGRAASYNEVGRIIAFLASDDAAYITGENLKVDGGLTRSV
jgi:NAD(P)-dependent dehydrogenase (short-subunit alcohol dehydrogenase family)